MCSDIDQLDTYPPLDRVRLQSRLASCAVGHTIDYHAAIPSTMPRAHELAQDPTVRAGAIVTAEEQTAGRGRRSRAWLAPARTALLTSFVLKPPLFALPATHAPMLAAVAAYDAVDAILSAFDPATAARLSLKWPNDLLIDEHKVAGLLAESRLQPDGSLAYVILGIGINTNQTAADLPPATENMLPPTSLRQATGRPVDRTELLACLCERLAAWQTGPTAAELHLAWKRRLSTLGQRVAVHTTTVAEAPNWIGTAVDVDPSGALLVIADDGAQRRFEVGEVSLRPLPAP